MSEASWQVSINIRSERREGVIVTRRAPWLVGVELYFDDLPRAKAFYAEVLGLALAEEAPDHHAKFQTGEAFLWLEKRGAEPYSSADKAVVFFEVDNLEPVLAEVESRHLVQHEASAAPPWAMLHDPEGHNGLLLEAPARAGT